MTERLYYTHSYLTEFDAVVVDVRIAQGRTWVALDRSAFYPTAGGQPNDMGVLGGASVLDVVAENGILWHMLDGGLFASGQEVHGSIDWARRYDHMQQHSGQHLISQIAERLYGWETVSVHIGVESNTLDLDTPLLDTAQIEAMEALCMEKVYAALPIRSYFVEPDALAAVPLRRPPKVQGTVRIVEIDAYDYSACGGTHCRTTAEVGPIKITGSERRRGIVRLSFLCGARAWTDYRRQHAILGQTAALFSAERTQVPALTERALAQLKDAQRRGSDVTGRLLAYEAGALLDGAEEVGALRVVTLLREDLDADGLRILASLLTRGPNVVALLASTEGGTLILTFARSATGADALHMGTLLKTTLQQVGGKGGGRPEFAQGGGGETAHGLRLLEFAQTLLKTALAQA